MFSNFQNYFLRIFQIPGINFFIKYCLPIIIFFGINYFFYAPFYKQLLSPQNQNQLILQGEYPIYEFVAETVRKKILAFSNPFGITYNVLYPFGWRYAFDDVAPINGIYFLLLRPFLSIHQSFIVIVLVSILMNAVCMYYLLRILSIKKSIAYIVSIIFAYTPFVSLRLPAHPTYVAIYLFPFSTLCVLKLIYTSTPKKKQKLFWSLMIGISLALFALTNLYFTVMYGLLTILFIIFSYSKRLKVILTENMYYLGIAIITTVVLLLPWLLEVYKIVLLRTIDKPPNIDDMIAFSADLITIIIPSSLNPFYRGTVNLLGQKYEYIQNIFENFTYPGALLLYGIVAFFIFRKKMAKELKPLILTLLSFFLLTLGPYLHIFGINTHIPLPYLFISYIPVLQMARAPGRFIVPFIFLASILLAYVLQHILKNKSDRQQTIFIIFIGIIFFIDQNIQIQQAPTILLPSKLYQYIDKQPSSPLLEIPFSIRDSVKNFGHYHTHWSSYATLLHNRPIFGVYAGRVPNSIYLYYLKNPLLNPLAQIIDINELNVKEKAKTINPQEMLTAADIYGIKYSILKTDEPFAKEIASILRQLHFKKIKTERNYILFERNIQNVEINQINFDSTYPDILIGDGWSPREKGEKSRWMMSKTSRIFLLTGSTSKTKLTVTGQSIVTRQTLQVYMNSKYQGSIEFNPENYTEVVLPLTNPPQKGLNIFTFYAKRNNRPSDYILNSQDKRPLSLHVSYIGLQ